MPPQLPLVLAIAAAILIVVGRLRKRWPAAAVGYALLVLAGVVVLVARGRL